MIMFAYKVGGWVRPNAYVIIRRTDSHLTLFNFSKKAFKHFKSCFFILVSNEEIKQIKGFAEILKPFSEKANKHNFRRIFPSYHRMISYH